mmetsp:Transcript_119757/g.344147  ORF Transcript_119757/g.344147 Transcript_119757/m.344147 type:complete len:209 (+) Transcript_119757:476-1102(+)
MRPGSMPPASLRCPWSMGRPADRPKILGGGVSSPALLGVIAPMLRSETVRSEPWALELEVMGGNEGRCCGPGPEMPRATMVGPALPLLEAPTVAAWAEAGANMRSGCGDDASCELSGVEVPSESSGLPSSDRPSNTVGTLGVMPRRSENMPLPLAPRRPSPPRAPRTIAFSIDSWDFTARLSSLTSSCNGECSILSSVNWLSTFCIAK